METRIEKKENPNRVSVRQHRDSILPAIDESLLLSQWLVLGFAVEWGARVRSWAGVKYLLASGLP